MDSKVAQCESNGKMVPVDVCAGVRTAAASIRKLTKTGRENRTRKTRSNPRNTFSSSSRCSDRSLFIVLNEFVEDQFHRDFDGLEST